MGNSSDDQSMSALAGMALGSVLGWFLKGFFATLGACLALKMMGYL